MAASYGWINFSATAKRTSAPLKTPPKTGPATAEAVHVQLSAVDQRARLSGRTSSVSITQTQLTMPPAPRPDRTRAKIRKSMD